MAVAILARPEDSAIGDIERGKERCRAVAHVIVSHRASAAFLERQAGLRAVQSLNLALLITTEHDRVLGRVELEPDHVFELFRKARIVGDLEGAQQMRFQAMLPPDACDGAGANLHGLGH